MNRNLGTSCATCLALFVVALTGVSACGGGSSNGPGGGNGGLNVSFGGLWEGTWSTTNPALPGVSTTAPGTVTLQLDQNGTTVTGTATFVGHPCLTSCNVSCQVNGHDIWGSFDTGSGQMMFSGSCPDSGHCSGPHHANTLTATFEIPDGPCAGEIGVLELMPVPPGATDAPETGVLQVGELILIDDRTAGGFVRLPVIHVP